MTKNEMKTIKTRKELRQLADANGYIFKPGRKTPILRMFEDGTISRADVRLDHCLPMTVKDAVHTLTL